MGDCLFALKRVTEREEVSAREQEMESHSTINKPHAVCLPFPAQGHLNPLLQLAKLLYHKGFYITYVLTEYNYNRLLKSRGPNALDSLPDFQFKTIPDGLPPSDAESTQDIPSLCDSTSKTCPVPFRQLLAKLNSSDSNPTVTCVVTDGFMTFPLEAAEELGIPAVVFWTPSACGFLSYAYYKHLVDRGLIPLKDWSYLTNGYLETTVDSMPGFMKDIQLRDLPSFVRTTDPDDIMLNFCIREAKRSLKASAIVVNTFDDLERDVLAALSSIFPPVYSVGPLQLLVNQLPRNNLSSLGSNLWKNDPECLKWLDSKKPKSVILVNYGSITVMTNEHLIEFAWGLANSKQNFLWIIRPDLVRGETAVLPPEFLEETKERGLLASWCAQEQILKHPSIGGFLSHMGWNSTLESLFSGVPMLCWPFFAEQQTNCRFACTEWGVGMEIDNNVKRDEVEKLVRELMEGEKGKEMKKKAMEWKAKAHEATGPNGVSTMNLDKLIKEVLLSQKP